MPPNLLTIVPQYIFALILKYKYIILFPILVIEGPIATIISGILASPSYQEFNIIFLYFFVVFADVFGDTMYYSIGRYAGPKVISKFKKWRGVDDDYEEKVKIFFKENGNLTILLGKITHGLGWPVMVAAGSARMQYSRFITLCVIASLIKTIFLLGMGYYYTKDISLISYYLGSSGTTLLTLIIVAIITYRVFLKPKK